nr:unnamed protein product [Digitaria exilis]
MLRMLAPLLPAAVEYAKGLRPFLGVGNSVPQKLRGTRDIGEGLERGRQRRVTFAAAGIAPLRVWAAAGLGGRLGRSGRLVPVRSGFLCGRFAGLAQLGAGAGGVVVVLLGGGVAL